ncbi:hypothetical protein [Rhizobium sp. WYJ-E13]|uniref:ATP dependent DNA ligase n=1 Tax=Rhizobium sp. WYJ-E13 TaxID=2849093 RepID=UPI0020A76950|nr:hypothetical protein [Rhizobium sp. WYJ-E13]
MTKTFQAINRFVLVGYELSTVARGLIGALLLAAYQGDRLVYVGSVGTGFKEREAWQLLDLMDKLKTTRPTVKYDGSRRNVVWLEPTLIADVEYRARTHDGRPRDASYKGHRETQGNASVFWNAQS